MPKAEVNGLRVHYQQTGRGLNLVLIHGLLSNVAFWYLSVMPELSRRFRVTAYDLRGHGYTDMPPVGYTARDLAADLHGLVMGLGLAPVHLVGHSFGGAVALQYAAAHPDQVRSLILADARVPGLPPAFPAAHSRRWRQRAARLRQAGIEVPDDLPRVAYGLVEDLARAHARRQDTDGGAWEAGALQAAWQTDSPVARRWLRLMRTTSAAVELGEVAGLTAERIRAVHQPTLAIYGQHSGCLNTLRALSKLLPNCRRVLVPGVGHLHPVLAPETFVREVRSFVLAQEA